MSAQIATLPSGRPLACEVQDAKGHTLKLWCAGPFDLHAPVKVETAATLWMGEIWACEPASSGFSIEIEVSQILRDPAAVERMAAEFRRMPSTKETPQHLA